MYSPADLAYTSQRIPKPNGLFYYYETSKGEVIESPEFSDKIQRQRIQANIRNQILINKNGDF